jgi:hypothetical protein
LGIGGEESGGENPANAMKLVAEDVTAVVLHGSGHWVAEQAPDELLAALTDFLAPYREEALSSEGSSWANALVEAYLEE